ncbi:COBRA-like isoform X1 [Populus alba x Populus x berolinensis]|nr:COBRA-like isoform X1 [Populus alba x Populus x berolinensis]
MAQRPLSLLCLEQNKVLVSPIMSFLSKSTVLLLFVLCCTSFTSTEAYDALDPNGNITIKWDVVNWTPDGYVAVVTIYNYQQYRHIEAPGWSLGWTWANNEVIWSMFGGQTTGQGDCSRFKGNIPRCCKKSPTVVDLSPRTPRNQKIANCCKGGLISSMVQDPANAASSFQLSVGAAGTTNETIRIPKNITLKTPGPGLYMWSCKNYKRRVTKALSKNNSTEEIDLEYYMHILTIPGSQGSYLLCLPLIFPQQDNSTLPDMFLWLPKKQHSFKGLPKSPHVPGPGQKNTITPLVQCTSHMCPIKIQWHLKLNYKDYWRATIIITNLNYHTNYTQWNLIVQHPNLDNLTQVFGSKYKALTSLSTPNDTAMLWGIKHYNDVLMQAGRHGKVHLELLFRKDKATFTSKKGWAFPQRIHFNGDRCVMPPPDAYPLVA